MTQIMQTDTKKCTKCGTVKTLNEYHKAGKYKGQQQYRPDCKMCRAKFTDQQRANEYTRRWRQRNPEKAAQLRRQWKETHKEKIAEYGQRYRETHKEDHRKYHIANREKLIERAKRWRIDNPGQYKETNRKYREANHEKMNEKRRKHYEQNRESERARERQYCKTHREQIRKNKRKYYEANKEKVANRKHQWDKSNPERARELKQRRRARKNGATGTFTEAQFQSLCDHYGNICLRCGEPHPLTRDHVVPLIDGGSNDISNIQPLCGPCNSTKGIKSTDYRNNIPSQEILCRR